MSVRLIVFEKIDFDHIAQTNLSRPLIVLDMRWLTGENHNFVGTKGDLDF